MEERFYSAQQLAAMRIPRYPTTDRGMRDVCVREQWPQRQVRAQGGKKGIRTEYQPPPEVQRLIDEIEGRGPVASVATGGRPSAGDAEFILVPRYNAEASAGAGSLVERESEIGRLAFRRDWLSEKGLSVKDLAVIRVKGDSMSPTIRDGSLVLVNTSQEKVGEDGIYVLVYEGHLVAKRLQADFATGGLFILSDNPSYKERYVAKDSAEGLYIIGRAIWAGGEI